MGEFEELIKEYRKAVKDARKLLNGCLPEEEKTIQAMITDLTYAIEWMERGHDNTSHHAGIYRAALGGYEKRRVLLEGIENFAATKYFTHLLLGEEQAERQLSIDEKNLIGECLSGLSERQMTVYILHTAHVRTYEEIAEELCIKVSTVQTHIERAREKISERLKELGYSEEAV